MLTDREVVSTLEMLKNEHLDVRAITLGLSLMDCVSDDIGRLTAKILNKITHHAENLVKTCDRVGEKYGIPVVNKRIAVSPMSALAGPFTSEQMVKVAKVLDRAGAEVGVDFVGGFGALVEKGFSKGDLALIGAIPQALAETSRVCSSVNVASSRDGINMDAVKLMGETIKKTAELTADREAMGCAKLVVFANIPPDMPFMAGAYQGLGEPDAVINVGVSGPGVVKKAVDRVMARKPRPSFDLVSETIKRTAYKVTRVGELMGREVAEGLGLPFGVVDLSLAPTPQVGDSVGEIFQSLGLKAIGVPGSTALLALLNDAVKKGGAFASSHVGGLSGAFIPVSEDLGIGQAAEDGYLNIEKLEAMTAVCSVGLDMVSVPGDTSAATLAAIIADEMAIGMINHKTTAVRIIPVPGKKAGDKVHYGGLLGWANIMNVADYAEAADFINLGGRIPAPVHSLKN
ncbi:PFL family protein [Deltaproteobacteria bacterium OttesenSCG-928-K17]|nr:PFL family protein [Deltaproteobacteria bacterium OttesenSCG-928-K17]